VSAAELARRTRRLMPAPMFSPPPVGHNRGPPLDPESGWRAFCWRRAYARAWKTPPREIALARLARAEELGTSYHEYAAVLLDRGIHL
jgi:hypothetical protein